MALAITWIGDEFPANRVGNFWYARDVMGIPLQYPAFAGLALLLSPLLLGRPPISAPNRLKAHGMWRWAVAIWISLLLTIAFAIVTQAPEPFADWRNFIVVAIACSFTLRWLAGRRWSEGAVLDLAIGYGVISIVVLVRWLLGGGAWVFDLKTPVFYWPALFMMLFGALVCTAAWLTGLTELTRYRAIGVRLSAVGTWLVLLLSFRRSFWAAAAVGLSVVLYDALRRRQVSTAHILGIIAIALLVGGSAVIALGTDSVVDRLASFSPSAAGAYSQTNVDHVNDLVEAFRQISREPITGLGIGQYYETPLLAEWKETSFEVHNVVLQVWLKFGLVGLISFLGFHWAWVRAARTTSARSPLLQATHRAVAAYIAAQFASTMVQTWVYGRFQTAIQLGILLGCILALPARQEAPEALKISAATTRAESLALNSVSPFTGRFDQATES